MIASIYYLYVSCKSIIDRRGRGSLITGTLIISFVLGVVYHIIFKPAQLLEFYASSALSIVVGMHLVTFLSGKDRFIDHVGMLIISLILIYYAGYLVGGISIVWTLILIVIRFVIIGPTDGDIYKMKIVKILISRKKE